MNESRNVKVLIVEDNPGDARLVRALLLESMLERFSCTIAERLSDARELCKEEPFDAVLLDLSLPDSFGLETITSMRRAAPDLPIVVLTGLDDEELGMQAIAQGCQDFVVKGRGDGDLLRRAIRYAIQRKTAEDDLRASEDRYRSLIDVSPDGVLVCEHLDIRFANPMAVTMLGAESSEMLEGQKLDRFLNPESTTALLDMARLKPGILRPHFIECEISSLEGRLFSAEAISVPMSEQSGDLYQVILRDITERIEAEREHRLAAAVFMTSSEGMMVTDKDQNIIKVNPAFTRVTGYEPEDVLGRKPKLLSSGQHNADFYHELWKSLNEGGNWQGEIWNRKKNGEVYIQRASISAIQDKDSRIENYFAVFSDITLEKRLAEEVKYRATHDALTGLPNRTLLTDRLEQALPGTQARGAGLAVLFIDLDGFKPVNDTHGHLVGDLLLQGVARRLINGVREDDTVARLGGDEFVAIVHTDGSRREAEHVGNRLLNALKQTFSLGVSAGERRSHVLEARIGGSIGISLFPDDGTTAPDLLDAADRAMYAAKEAGKGVLRFASAPGSE